MALRAMASSGADHPVLSSSADNNSDVEIDNNEVVRYVLSTPEKTWRNLHGGEHNEVFLVGTKGQRQYVVKKIRKANAWKNKQNEIRELVILRDVRHERIVPFYGHINMEFELQLIMGFMPMGSLSNYVYMKPLHLAKIRLFTCQILQGTVYLHSKSIIHRDIKGANVLLEEEDKVRLTDFGMSIISEMSNAATNTAGTYNYKAPETFETGVVHDTKADIWSIGCTAIEMFTGQLPYGVMSCMSGMIDTLTKEKKRPDQGLENVPQDLQEFFNKCFQFQPSERPSAQELLSEDAFCQTL